MKKNDIVIAALRQFSKHSYDSASVNTIIKDSHTSKGTFYHYFNNKEALYVHLAEKVLMDKINYFKNIELENHTKDIKNIFDLLHSQVEKSIDFSIDFPEYVAFIIQVRKETNEILREKVLSKMGDVSSEYYSPIIKEHINNGIIRKDLPTDFIVRLVAYLLTNFLEFMKTMGCSLSIDNKDYIKEQYHHYINFIERGLSTE